MSCDYCTNPLYVGTKCKNCGREPAPVQQEPVAWEQYGIKFAKGRKLTYGKPENLPSYIGVRALVYVDTPPAQPAVPDSIHHTDLSESLEYIQGWNDCRQAMLEMMK